MQLISRGKVNKSFIAEMILLPQKFSSPELTNQVFQIQFALKKIIIFLISRIYSL